MLDQERNDIIDEFGKTLRDLSERVLKLEKYREEERLEELDNIKYLTGGVQENDETKHI